MKSKFEVLPGVRDLRFDTLRGLFLVCMTINHLPTEMRSFTDQSLGIFSAAEGFINRTRKTSTKEITPTTQKTSK